MLRGSNSLLEFLATSTFETLATTTNAAATSTIRFATAWNSTETQDMLLFIDHDSSLYEWSGAIGTFSSAAATTLTLNENVGEMRFLTSGTRRFQARDTSGIWQVFTYTGESGSQFTGVTPDPTTFTFGANALVVQRIRENTSAPASGYTNDFIKTLNNQVWI